MTIYDEMALMNDINAACAAAAVNHDQPMPRPPPKPSVQSRLEMLAELRNSNAISESEYDAKRRQIIDEI